MLCVPAGLGAQQLEYAPAFLDPSANQMAPPVMPFGPGSYVVEPPHHRWWRATGECFFNLLHPSIGLCGDLTGSGVCESWLRRPLSAGSFVGPVFGTELLDDWVGEEAGYLGGYRLGVDLDQFWGVETRLAFSFIGLDDSPRAKAAQQAADDAAGIAPDDPFRHRFDDGRYADLLFWDVDLVYYPWGDQRWRPYGMVGAGLTHVAFEDRLNRRIHDTLFTMPLAIGLKRRVTECTAWRLEVADNLAFGNRVKTLHNISVTVGFEFRFGGSRTAYWPWNPGRHYR